MIAYIVALLYYTVQRRFLRKPFCWMSNYWIYISYLATLLVSFSLFHPWCDVAALSIQCSHASCGGAKFKTGCRERLFCFFSTLVSGCFHQKNVHRTQICWKYEIFSLPWFKMSPCLLQSASVLNKHVTFYGLYDSLFELLHNMYIFNLLKNQVLKPRFYSPCI